MIATEQAADAAGDVLAQGELLCGGCGLTVRARGLPSDWQRVTYREYARPRRATTVLACSVSCAQVAADRALVGQRGPWAVIRSIGDAVSWPLLVKGGF